MSDLTSSMGLNIGRFITSTNDLRDSFVVSPAFDALATAALPPMLSLPDSPLGLPGASIPCDALATFGTDALPSQFSSIEVKDPIPSSNFDNDIDICPICMIALETSTNTFDSPCKHVFCMECLYKYGEFCSPIANKTTRGTVVDRYPWEMKPGTKCRLQNEYHRISCPVCRAYFTVKPRTTLQRPDFHNRLCPADYIFDYIDDEWERRMIQSAYDTITKYNHWEYMHNFTVDAATGFMSNRDPDMKQLMTYIDNDYMGHSGGSMAFTMRKIHFIAIYGVDEYKRFMYTRQMC
jgi:hypothetical protein